MPGFAFVPKVRDPSGSTLKASRGHSSAPPVQKVGDRWVASSMIAAPNGMGSPALPGGTPDALRESVQRMFDLEPDNPPTPPIDSLATRRDSAVTERIMAWQPVTERELSIFSRTGSKRSQATSPSFPLPAISRMESYNKAETVLSFDPNDLNPSRSASQVGRKSITQPVQADPSHILPALEGRSAYDAITIYPDPTHVSHITFPKPLVRGLPVVPIPYGTQTGGLETIASGTNSTCDTEDTIQTPALRSSGLTSPSSLDHTLLAKLDDHKTEHSTMSKQIDGVHVDLRHVILSLSALVDNSRGPDGALAMPKGLDDKLNTIQMDVKAIENALNLSSLSTSRLTQAEDLGEPKLAEVHQKLDAIAKLCEDVLAKGNGIVPAGIANDEKNATPILVGKGPLGIVVDSEEAKSAGDEVAQIMAELVGSIPSAGAQLTTDRNV